MTKEEHKQSRFHTSGGGEQEKPKEVSTKPEAGQSPGSHCCLPGSSFTQPANEVSVGGKPASAGGASTLSCHSLQHANAGEYWSLAAVIQRSELLLQCSQPHVRLRCRSSEDSRGSVFYLAAALRFYLVSAPPSPQLRLCRPRRPEVDPVAGLVKACSCQ